MQSKILFLYLFSVFLSTIVTASTVIEIQGSASETVKPDICHIILGFEGAAKEAPVAMTENAQHLNSAIAALQALQTTPGTLNISTYDYTLMPRYESVQRGYDSGPRWVQELTGYSVSTRISVITSVLDSAPSLLSTALQNGANRVDSISFRVSKAVSEKLELDLLEKATLNAFEKAKHIAAAAGMQLKQSVWMSEPKTYHPLRERAMNDMIVGDSFGSPSVTARDQVVSVVLDFKFEAVDMTCENSLVD